MRFQRTFCNIAAGIVLIMLSAAVHAGQDTPRYLYSDAVQEITQLYWLAETANTCGWATRAEADEFEAFAVRFLTAHLSGTHRAALYSMIEESSYQPAVQRVAFENRALNCEQSRWKNGWVTFKAAADENATRY